LWVVRNQALLLLVSRFGSIPPLTGLRLGRRVVNIVGVARYYVTVLSGDPSRTAAEVAAEAGAEVIRKMRVPDGVAALATDVQIEALTAAGNTVRRHADLAEGRAERLAEVGEGDRYAEALRRLAGR
jgi:urease gamma subunit